MARQNCYCGVVAYAHCVRCRNGVCSGHFRGNEHNSAWLYCDYGQGDTLSHAAHQRGYWSAPRSPFVCRDCRKKDGDVHAQRILQMTRGWKKDPFEFALGAASLGYVITKPGITYADIIQRWLNLNLKFRETVPVLRRVHAEKRRWGHVVGPAKYTYDRLPGWVFPRTVSVLSEGRLGTSYSWTSPTGILTDGRVLQGGNFINKPYQGEPYRLLVEMARKLFLVGREPWKGPDDNW